MAATNPVTQAMLLLSEDVRLLILLSLSEKPQTAAGLAQIAGIRVPCIQRYLLQLRRVGWVSSDRNDRCGPWVWSLTSAIRVLPNRLEIQAGDRLICISNQTRKK